MGKESSASVSAQTHICHTSKKLTYRQIQKMLLLKEYHKRRAAEYVQSKAGAKCRMGLFLYIKAYEGIPSYPLPLTSFKELCFGSEANVLFYCDNSCLFVPNIVNSFGISSRTHFNQISIELFLGYFHNGPQPVCQ